jgi:hypothetical protein
MNFSIQPLRQPIGHPVINFGPLLSRPITIVTALVSAFGRGHGAPRERLYGPALGDRAMWILMYVAMIASLSAMGMLPVAEYRDQLPHADP